jgi:hypothetical protein
MVVGFSENISERECACMGAEKIISSGWSAYAGCTPAEAKSLPPRDFDVAGGVINDQYRVSGGVIGSRLMDLGFSQGVVVEAIDGRRVRSVDELHLLLEEMPYELPASVLLMNRHVPKRPTEVHFITRAVMDDLSRLVAEARWSELQRSRCVRPRGPVGLERGWLRIKMGYLDAVAYDPKCTDHDTRDLARLAAAIRGAARATMRRRVTAPLSRAECKKLDNLPPWFELEEGDRVTELRYVDWLAH